MPLISLPVFVQGYAASSVNDGGPNGGVTGGLVLSGTTVAWYGAKNGVFGCSASALDAGGNDAILAGVLTVRPPTQVMVRLR